VPVSLAPDSDASNVNDKPAGNIGETMLVIGTLLVKYVFATKKFEDGSTGTPTKLLDNTGGSNSTVSPKENVKG
jgi:hypothetical protein